MADKKIEEVRRLKTLSHQGGGEERIKKQKAAGKMTAHERIDLLLDKGSFREIDAQAIPFGDDTFD
ncbi:MAG: methylmalonyl-CoA carboxyltransferase, partial [Candidatus Promineifilaceae bacterium]